MSISSSFKVDSSVEVVSERHAKFYSANTGIIKSLNRLGTVLMAGIEFPNGRFAWIAENCLKAL